MPFKTNFQLDNINIFFLFFSSLVIIVSSEFVFCFCTLLINKFFSVLCNDSNLEVVLYGFFMEMINTRDFEKEAQHKLTQSIYDFIAGGAGDEYTMNRNIEAFKQIHLVPQIFRSSSDTNTSITLLNHQLSHPFMVAPLAFHSCVHPQGEIATVRAANQMGIIMVLSTMSSTPLETVAKEATLPLWFQLYILKDRHITQLLIQRVTAAGYTALVFLILII